MPMLRSLSGRLLALAVAVALCSTIATAWLTQRFTSEQLNSQFAWATEETNIFNALDAAARSSPDRLDAIVDAHAEHYGIRIVVTGEYGQIVADSDPSSATGEASALPARRIGYLNLPNASDSGRTPWVPVGKVYVDYDPSIDILTGDWRWRIGLTILAAAAFVIVVTVAAGRVLTRPLRKLTEAVREFEAGNRSARVDATGFNEVAGLGRAFNEMSAAIETGEQARKAMVSDVSHELRTPLANIHGYLEAAADGVVDIDGVLIDTLRAETGHLVTLVDDLQDLALADAGMLHIHPEECDASIIADQVVAATYPRAQEAGVSLTSSVPPRAVLFTDPVRLRQALGNLVENAVRLTPADGVVAVDVQERGDDVVISVSDTGPGIAAEHLPHLFDRFYRVDASRSRASGGSGLGLAISRQFVTAMGGSIDVTSEEGKGSTFTITLPRAVAPVPLSS